MLFFLFFSRAEKVFTRSLDLLMRCISLSEACRRCCASKELFSIIQYPLYFMHGILVFELEFDLNSS